MAVLRYYGQWAWMVFRPTLGLLDGTAAVAGAAVPLAVKLLGGNREMEADLIGRATLYALGAMILLRFLAAPFLLWQSRDDSDRLGYVRRHLRRAARDLYRLESRKEFEQWKLETSTFIFKSLGEIRATDFRQQTVGVWADSDATPDTRREAKESRRRCRRHLRRLAKTVRHASLQDSFQVKE